eukprot:m.53771 g.53771  ORF g.53771 m.53771 type:complete len:748 (+) comp12821_c0_seq2:341-2584(+)
MMSMALNEGSTRIRKTPRRRVTYSIDADDLVKYPKSILQRFLVDAGHDTDPMKKSYVKDVWEKWENYKGPRLPDDICDLGAGRMKDFKDNVEAAHLTRTGQRYLKEERERRMNRVQKRNSRKRLGDDSSGRRSSRSRPFTNAFGGLAGLQQQLAGAQGGIHPNLLPFLVLPTNVGGLQSDITQQLLQAASLTSPQSQMLGLHLSPLQAANMIQLSQQQQQHQQQHQQSANEPSPLGVNSHLLASVSAQLQAQIQAQARAHAQALEQEQQRQNQDKLSDQGQTHSTLSSLRTETNKSVPIIRNDITDVATSALHLHNASKPSPLAPPLMESITSPPPNAYQVSALEQLRMLYMPQMSALQTPTFMPSSSSTTLHQDPAAMQHLLQVQQDLISQLDTQQERPDDAHDNSAVNQSAESHAAPGEDEEEDDGDDDNEYAASLVPPPPPKPPTFQPSMLMPALNLSGPSPLRPPDASAQCVQFLQQAWDNGQLQAPPTPKPTADGHQEEVKTPTRASLPDVARLPSAFFPEMFSPLRTANLPNLTLPSPGTFEGFATPDLNMHAAFSPLVGGGMTPRKASLASPSVHDNILLASPQFLIGHSSPLNPYLFSPFNYAGAFSPRRLSMDDGGSAARSAFGMPVPADDATTSGRRARPRKGRNLTLPGSSLATNRTDDTDLLAATETVIRTDRAPSSEELAPLASMDVASTSSFTTSVSGAAKQASTTSSNRNASRKQRPKATAVKPAAKKPKRT